MGKSWFFCVKKVLISDPKQRKEQKTRKAKKWFGKENKVSGESSYTAAVVKEDAEIKEEQTRHAYSLAVATAAAAEAAVAAAEAAAEVVRLTTLSRFAGKSREEIAVIKIQTAFRGYMARRALRALQGLVRLKSRIQGKSVRRQATSTLQSMQTLARLQYQVRERRLRLSRDKQSHKESVQRKPNQDSDKIGEDWDDSRMSREKLEENMLNKQVATMRRERALSYAYTHQKPSKTSSKLETQTFTDPNSPHWGWSWLERWMATHPNQNHLATPDKVATPAMSIQRSRTSTSRRGTPVKGSSPRLRLRQRQVISDEDSRSVVSIQSEQTCQRRHSVCGSTSSRDDESVSSFTQSVPGYMAPTQAAKARARVSTVGAEKTNGPVKKRFSFSGSPRTTVRRFSGL